MDTNQTSANPTQGSNTGQRILTGTGQHPFNTVIVTEPRKTSRPSMFKTAAEDTKEAMKDAGEQCATCAVGCVYRTCCGIGKDQS